MPGVNNSRVKIYATSHNLAPKKAYPNLLEFLYAKRAEPPEQVRSCLTTVNADGRLIASRSQIFPGQENVAEYAEFCSAMNTATSFRQEKPCFPLQFVIEKKMFSFVPLLLSLDANHLLNEYDYFTMLIRANAPLDVITSIVDYCITHNKINEDKKFDALFAAYNKNLNYHLDKFEAVHRYCFKLSFCEILDGKPPRGMSVDDYNRYVSDHYEYLMMHHDTMIRLRKIYMQIIEIKQDYKSKLKINLALENEDTITRIMRVDQKSKEPSDTPEYQKLKDLLQRHALRPEDLRLIAVVLTEDERPNPTLAALYFSYRNFNIDEDYVLFKKHLVNVSPADHSPASKERLTNLLEFYLNKSELVKLKSKINTMVDENRMEQNFNLAWTKTFTPPFIDIAVTGRKLRTVQSTKTFEHMYDNKVVDNTSGGYSEYYSKIKYTLFKSPKTPPPASHSENSYPKAYVSPKPSAPE